MLSVCVPNEPGGLAGYEALSTEEVIDLSQLATHPPHRFFRPLPAPMPSDASAGGESRLTLEKDRFYILATKEVRLRPTAATSINSSHAKRRVLLRSFN